MLKRTLKAVTAFTLLVGCYLGYVRIFAVVVDQLKATRRPDTFMFAIKDSNHKREAIAYARAAFGRDHWSATEDLPYRYYNSERGFWIYAQEWERIVEENGVRYDGKRMRLKPFALIMKSSDGKNTKTITSDVAVFDLSEPLSFNVNPDGEPLKINHAHLEPNVEIRDDKSTPGDRGDDMRIGPLTTVDYEDATQQITTDSDVIIRDPDMVATSIGMVIQLRKDAAPRPVGSSAGFEGAERMDLLKNVHVVIRDVGKSGLLPGSASPRRATKDSTGATAKVTVDPSRNKAGPETPDEPTPLDLRCDSKMQVYLPKPQLPVLIGPPAPPAPTFVQFDRNVVALRGPLDGQPDQLTCDTLKLSLVPGGKSAKKEGSPPDQSPKQGPSRPGRAAAAAQSAANANPIAETGAQTVAQFDTPAGDGSDPASQSQAATGPAGDDNKGLFGNLTLQRAHATGHAVWLYLPAQGVKLRCNEMIHTRFAPFKPDMTYFRGDLTRQVEIVKIDVVQDEGPEHGKVTAVTNIQTVDATMLDNGNGLDTANVAANGPGRLETRPDRDQPVERIAIWQDKMYLRNEIGPDGQIVHKIVDLTGNRPTFIDKVQETQLDSAHWIRVWLKPKPKPASSPAVEEQAAMRVASAAGTGARGAESTVVAGPDPTAFSSTAANDDSPAGDHHRSETGLGGGNFQIERLLAIRDVHLIAPSKTLTARERLDADFIAAAPAPVAAAAPAPVAAAAPAPAGSAAPARADNTSNATAAKTDQVQEQGQEPVASQEPIVAQDGAEKKLPEPPMVGSADRIWAKVEMVPKSDGESRSSNRTAGTKTTSATKTRTASTAPGMGETNSEIRNVWMWGSVFLHQDPEEGKTKGQEASGEALYLDNRGPGKVISYIYQRDPNEKTFLPGPLPPARVENEDMKITAAGVLNMNQETDEAWVEGPGTLTQLPAKTPAATGPANTPPAGNPAVPPAVTGSQATTRSTTVLAQTNGEGDSTMPLAETPASKPKTRAGRPLSDKAPTTIAFSEGMVFNGRTIDPDGAPSARADFFGIVTAQMEDALLHAEEQMIAYTDRVVPLAQLGAMSKARSKPKPDGNASDPGDTEADSQPQLTLIYCYRKAVLINRKVDPNTPTVLQQLRIEADDILEHDRRTGDFEVPRNGVVYQYDRSNNSSIAPGINLDGENNSSPNPTGTPRTVTPTSGRAPNRSSRPVSASAADTRGASPADQPKASTESKAGEIPPLVVTQIYFIKGMRGRFGTGQEPEKVTNNWYEFFGDIQLARAKVPNTQTTLNFDKLPSDGLFLTSQTLRVTTEPPPVGSPPSTPDRDYIKAWEKAYVWSSDKSLQSDVITYDSEKDLIYAFGEEGRGVVYAQQHAAGQPSTLGSAKAMRLNPKTGAMQFVDNASIQLIDKNTGIRPVAAKPYDPDAKKPKPPRKPFRLPTGNVERRGFTGQ